MEENTFNLIKKYPQENDNWSLVKVHNLVVPTRGEVQEELSLTNQKRLLYEVKGLFKESQAWKKQWTHHCSLNGHHASQEVPLEEWDWKTCHQWWKYFQHPPPRAKHLENHGATLCFIECKMPSQHEARTRDLPTLDVSEESMWVQEKKMTSKVKLHE